MGYWKKIYARKSTTYFPYALAWFRKKSVDQYASMESDFGPVSKSVKQPLCNLNAWAKNLNFSNVLLNISMKKSLKFE